VRTAGLALAILAAAASAALMGLAGWLIVRSAQTGLSVTSTFSWIFPAAGVEALAVVRTAARYGERLTTHEATLQLLARLRARVFASATRMAPRRLHRFHSGDLLDRVQADIDSLDRIWQNAIALQNFTLQGGLEKPEMKGRLP